MKTKNVMKRAMLLAWAMLAVCTISNCKSENEETKLPASKIIVGNWEQASIKVTDQNGNDIPLSTIEDIFVNISSSLTFDDNGTYTANYLDGTTRTGSWYVSDDETYLTIGDESWEIYSFNENELILAQEIQYNNSTYYVIYTYNKSSATEGQPEETPDENTEKGQSNTPPLTNLGSISDNNPYKPWGKNLVSKITEQTKNILQIHYFQYDKKSRIIEYQKELNGNIEFKINFIYDDENVYLYLNEKLTDIVAIGKNGYVTAMYDNERVSKDYTFTYNEQGMLTNLDTGEDSWSPSRDTNGNISRPDGNTFARSYVFFRYYANTLLNTTSIDLNGIIYSPNYYPWEKYIYEDSKGANLCLFDFLGKRCPNISDIEYSKYDSRIQTNQTISDYEGGTSSDLNNPSSKIYYIKAKDLVTKFEWEYKLEYIE